MGRRQSSRQIDGYSGLTDFPQYKYVGRVPLAGNLGFSDALTFGTNTALAAAGGAIESYIEIPCPMYLEGYALFNGDATLLRTADAALYVDSGSATCNQIVNSLASWSFTAASAQTRRVSVTTGAPVYLDPGGYWLVLRNTHASNAFNIRRITSPTFTASPNRQHATTIASLPASLDLDTNWTTTIAGVLALWLEARVLGRTTIL